MGGERTNNSTREEFISTISRNLKALSKELQVTIIALSQLNRGVESRTDKKPMLSDLRESGAIEQDADIVIFPFRPEYYWPDDVSLKGEGMFLVAKNRNGSTGKAEMKYNKSVTRFEDINNEISYGRPTSF
jgi:replicative DNA helicase